MSVNKTLIPILVISAASLLALLFLILFWPQDNSFEKIKVEIQKGAPLSEIARTLEDHKIISSPKTFKLAVKALGYETGIPAGMYQLQHAKNNYDIISQLVHGIPVMRRVTILEGWSMHQIADYIADRMKIDKTEFLTLCTDPQFLHQMNIPYDSMEGFLFPETYYFPENETPENIIRTMISEYHDFMDDTRRGRAAELGFSELELVTLASIIEGEAIYDSERPVISAVYHNRLKLGMRLQADPTIQYIIHDGPRRLLNRDLQIESPYNTYLHYGLPPGPINNPGKVSIQSALYPAENEFLYFVARGDGYHTFSKTQDEHNIAKRKFQKFRRENRRKNRENIKGKS